VGVDHGRRNQVVALERKRSLARVVVGCKRKHVAAHHVRHQDLRLVDEHPVKRQASLELIMLVDYEDLVGVIGEFIEGAQISQHRLERKISAHRNSFEVHQRDRKSVV